MKTVSVTRNSPRARPYSFQTFALISLTAWIMLSCGVMPVSYIARYPPEIPMPQGDVSMVIINRFDTTGLNPFSNKKDSIILTCFREYSNTLAAELNSFVKLKNPYSGTAPAATLSSGVMPSAIAGFAVENEADFVVIIESFETNRSKTVSFSDDSGSEVERYLGVISNITLYAKSGAQINKSRVYKETLIDADMAVDFFSGVISPRASLRRYGKVLYPLSREMAMMYARKFHPTEEYVTRNAYAGKEFAPFPEMMHAGNYSAAQDLLLPLTSGSNSSTAKRAAYNMYILREAEGKIEESRDWLKKSELN